MKIEKGITPPRVFKGFGTTFAKYPFAEMEIGDSVFFEGQDNNGKARWAMDKVQQRHGLKFTSAKQDGGLRIWRVA